MVIKILGSGCSNCTALTDNTVAALSKLGVEAEIVKVTDFSEMAQYGILATPGLVVNEKVVSYGKVLDPGEVASLIQKVAL